MDISKLTFLDCVHPLLVDDDDFPDYPYSVVGSGFLVLFKGHPCLVTAKHCFENYSLTGQEVCILNPMSNDGSFIQFDAVSRSEPTTDTEDTDFADIVIMRVKPGTVNPFDIAVGRLPVFPMNPRLIVKPDDPAIGTFLLRGYPLNLNAVDHEAKTIPRQSFTIGASFDRPDNSQHIFSLKVEPYRSITDGNGMSGGFALAFVHDGDVVQARFAGLIIRGFHGSQTARIIDARVVLRALEQASATFNLV